MSDRAIELRAKMNPRIRALMDKAELQAYYDAQQDHIEKFAELIVAACADAADDAYWARCPHIGDYVGEQMGYGTDTGITTWRINMEVNTIRSELKTENI